MVMRMELACASHAPQPILRHSDWAWLGAHSQEPERSSGSREKLLTKESGLGKWGSMGTKEKFDVTDLMAEVIENSEEAGRSPLSVPLSRHFDMEIRPSQNINLCCCCCAMTGGENEKARLPELPALGL